MDYAIENFIAFCDDMQIAEESIENLGYKFGNAIQKTIISLRHIIKRFLYNFYKIKKWYLPKDVKSSIDNLLDELDDPISMGTALDMRNKDVYRYISDIKSSKDWKFLNVNSKIISYSENDYVPINTNLIVGKLKTADAMLEKWEKVELQESFNDNVSKSTTTIIKLFSFQIEIISQYFKWGKQKNKDGQIIDLGESITVEIDPSNLF